ncbi:MAG: 16S rRNA (guanine(527)-N(7))-methyltransferase RsmG [Candidatus Pelagibacter sp. TMED202]|nr:MAG: 16S rRNA (guanine(527)-N(7))-methyltransferase RsmG [Candidatus Pelagibacter sp. TMED202]|tara:strand:- start:3566 stop:4183 length:618 start_codon:yes stop_codon:yes gene_type:complete
MEIKLLDNNLVNFCNDNFKNHRLISQKLYEYKKIVIYENKKMNLIGRSTIENFDQRHLLDCIQIIKYLPNKEKTLMDIGTGAGLPGIILSIIGYKNLHLVEKSPKKSLFLENCKSQLNLDYNVHNKSISDLTNLNIDYITARAFAPVEKILTSTKKIINKHTKFILHKGKSYLSELQLINKEKYSWETYSSLTSDVSKIIVIGAK